MSATAVHQILDQIKRLPEEDRRLLDNLLVRIEEEEWQQEAVQARKAARRKGIDQAVIDQAVEHVRYGQ